MRLFHGSPLDLSVLKPSRARGLSEFEGLEAVFLTGTFLQAALYAIGKGLKGRASFGVSETKLVVLGGFELKPGFVYEVEVDEKEVIEGEHGQYACLSELVPLKKTRVFPGDYVEHVVRVSSKKQLIKELERSN